MKIIILLFFFNLALIQGEKGVCSWYGVGLDGQYTANGEKYYGNQLTAAHMSLPFGTVVKATCADGRSTTVKINDRGQFGHLGRILDVSIAAGQQLGIYPDKGLCDCEVTVQGHSNPDTSTPPTIPATTQSPPVDPNSVDCSVPDKRYPHPKDCTKYYWCYSGEAHELQCNGGLWWDQDRVLCDYPNNVKRPGCK